MIITFIICRYLFFNKKQKRSLLSLNPLIYIKGKYILRNAK